jgi:hypothetical protein
VGNLGALWTSLKLGRQVSKGPYTNNPSDQNYGRHWNSLPLNPGQQVVQVQPGVAVRGGVRSPVNVRVASDGAIYVDTPSVERVGPVAGVAGRVLDQSGLSQPYYYTPQQVQVGPQPQENRVQYVVPGMQVRARTDGYVGRPADLSTRDQLRQLGGSSGDRGCVNIKLGS